MGSTRLPGKVLRRLAGDTVLGHVVRRVRLARRLDGICIATTESPSDEPIVVEAARLGVGCWRGSEQDVLARYHGAAKNCGASVIVRITSDCPLFDGVLLDQMIGAFCKLDEGVALKWDCMSNVLQRTYPRGLDAEIFTLNLLDRAHVEAKQPHEREHVTPYFYQHPELFRLQSFAGPEDWSAHRWTLDTPEDWQFIEAVYSTLGADCTTADVLNLLKARPELLKLNESVDQKKLVQ